MSVLVAHVVACLNDSIAQELFPIGLHVHQRVEFDVSNFFDLGVPFNRIRLSKVDSRHGIELFVRSHWYDAQRRFLHPLLTCLFVRRPATRVDDRMSILIYPFLGSTLTSVRQYRASGGGLISSLYAY